MSTVYEIVKKTCIPLKCGAMVRATASKFRRIMSAFRHDTPAKPWVK